MRLHTAKPTMRRTAMTGALLMASVALSACSNDTAGTEAGVDVADIQAEVGSYVGETVTVSADVDEIITPSAFTIAGTENTGIEPLLIVGAQEFDPVVEHDAAVRVTGEVRESFVLSEIEEEFGIDPPDDVFVDWEQEPYVVATEVAPVVVDE